MIVIRKYKEEDWSRLCEIHDAARIDELQESVDISVFRTLEEVFKEEGLFDSEIHVALFNNKATGFIAFDKNEITWLYVEPKYYTKGIGSTLLNYVLDNFETLGKIEVLHKNERAIKFYKKHGYKILKKIQLIFTEENGKYKTEGFVMGLENRLDRKTL